MVNQAYAIFHFTAFFCVKRNLPKRFIVCRVCVRVLVHLDHDLLGDVFYYISIWSIVLHTQRQQLLCLLSLFFLRARWYALKVINQICSQRRQWVTQLVWNERNVLRSHSKRQLSIRSARIVNVKKTKQINRQNKRNEMKEKEKNWNKDNIYITSMWKTEGKLSESDLTDFYLFVCAFTQHTSLCF